jgi:hypothetical protein
MDPPAATRLRVVHGRAEAGCNVFAVLLKRSFAIGGDGTLVRLAQDAPLRDVDAYWDDGDPTWSTVEHESELAAFKPRTDVVVVGHAHAPGGRPVQQLDVGVEVAGVRKVLRVTGERRCVYREGREPAFTEPRPFARMPMRWELAYGGRDERSTPGAEFHYPRNPAGRGVAVANRREVVDGLALPCIEDPTDLLVPERVVLGEVGRWNAQPLPQGLGWVPRTCYPRCSFVGAMPPYVRSDTVMREEALGWVPRQQVALAMQCRLPSWDARFNNGAHPSLQFAPLAGGELVRLANLNPGGGLLAFRLPEGLPRLTLDTGEGPRPLQSVLHTVSIQPDAGRVDLVWRGAFEYPDARWLARLARLEGGVEA